MFGRMLREGQGRTRDLKWAYFWLRVAEREGDASASKEADELQPAMQQADIDAAKEQLRYWHSSR